MIQSTLASNVNYLVETSTVTTITIASSNVAASITLQAGTLVYRQTKTITAVTTVAGKVTFNANGKRLAGCVSKTASLQNSFTVTCSYKPATRGYVIITTTLNPTDPTYIGDTSFTERLFIYNRSGRR
jgi:flagellar hook assembly protein FlgD